MEKEFTLNGILYAKFIKNIDEYSGTQIFSDKDDNIQLFLKITKQNEKTGAHFHNPYDDKTNHTDEIIIMQSGKIRIDFYSEIGAYIKSIIAQAGDIVIIYKGGHNIISLEPSKFLTINTKQDDDIRIIGANNFDLVIED